MKIITKIYILQFLFTLIVLSFMSFVYTNYESKYLNNLDNYVQTTASSFAKETLLSLRLIDYLNENNRELFRRINIEAKKRIEENNNVSLELLKEELIQKYSLDKMELELYMVDKNYIIYDTTFEPDLGFDLSFAEDTKKYIEQCNENSEGIYFVDGVVYDSLDKRYKIYTFTKIKKDTYLEMGFIDKRLNELYLSSSQSQDKMSKNKTNIYVVITLKEFQHEFSFTEDGKYSSKVDLFENMDRYYLSKKTNNPIINAVRYKKEVRVQRDNFIYVYKPILSHKEIKLLRDADIVAEIIIDVGDKLESFQRFKLIFSSISFGVVLLFIFIFIWTKRYVTTPTNRIVKSMRKLRLIEDEKLLAKKDEFGVIANEYNKLVISIKKEIELNKTLLVENRMFIADTVHQIRTPLSVIMMNSDLIKMAQIDNESEEFINQIYASINMLTNSYEDLAYITSHDTIEYNKMHLSLSDILRKRVNFFSTIANVNHKMILVMIEESIFYDINQIELERLIDNNISNAIKYAKTQEPITVELKKHDDEVRLSFYSYGEAIKDITMIFEKSYRENEEKRGLGLGLHMVKGICEKYDVTYEVKYRNNQNIFTYIFKI